MPRFFLATTLPGAATVDPKKIPPITIGLRASMNVPLSCRIGHAVDPHLSPGSTVPNSVTRCSPAGPRQAGWTAPCGTCGNGTSFVVFKLAVRVYHPYSWLEIRWLGRSANESPPKAGEQNAWQDGAFRFEHAMQSRAYRRDRAEQTRSAHCLIAESAHRSTRRTRWDIVAMILHKRLAN